MKRTPILLLTYNRADILKNTLQSLSGCNNSEEYDLYVHIDGPNIFRDEDVEKIGLVKNTIDLYAGRFHKTTVLEEKLHFGLANSVIKSVRDVIKICGRIIVIEDDLLLSYDFLDYMEAALDYYEDDPRIWTVTGYSPALYSLENCHKSVFFSYRGESWGWGTWIDRWIKVDWKIEDYDCFLSDYNYRKDFCKAGFDLPELLKKQMDGLVDSWAVRWCYAQSRNNMMTVHPTKNRVYHFGFENATHVEKEFPQIDLLDVYPEVLFEDNIDKNIMNEYRKFNGGSSESWNNAFAVDNDISKFESMFNVMNIWKSINERGHSISEFFKSREYKKVAIYGKGKIGKHIYYELLGSNTDVLYFVDKNSDMEDEIRCFAPDDELPVCDCIVVSVTTNVSEIYKQIAKSFYGEIIRIVDILNDRLTFV